MGLSSDVSLLKKEGNILFIHGDVWSPNEYEKDELMLNQNRGLLDVFRESDLALDPFTESILTINLDKASIALHMEIGCTIVEEYDGSRTTTTIFKGTKLYDDFIRLLF